MEINLSYIVSKQQEKQMDNTQGEGVLSWCLCPNHHNLAMKSRACSPGAQVWGYIPWHGRQLQPIKCPWMGRRTGLRLQNPCPTWLPSATQPRPGCSSTWGE